MNTPPAAPAGERSTLLFRRPDLQISLEQLPAGAPLETLEGGWAVFLPVAGEARWVVGDVFAPLRPGAALPLGGGRLVGAEGGCTGVLLRSTRTSDGTSAVPEEPWLLIGADAARGRRALAGAARRRIGGLELEIVEPGPAPGPPRRWPGGEVVWIVLRGRVTLGVDGQSSVDLGPGQVAVVPADGVSRLGGGTAALLVQVRLGGAGPAFVHLPCGAWARSCGLTEILGDGRVVLDGAGVVESLDGEARRLLGLTGPAEGRSLLGMLGEEDGAWLARALSDAGEPRRRRLRGGLGGIEATVVPWEAGGERSILHLRGARDGRGREAGGDVDLVVAIDPLKMALDRLAASTQWVVVWGEAGSGRSRFTRALHARSPWASGPPLWLDVSTLGADDVWTVLTRGRPGLLAFRWDVLGGQTLILTGLEALSPQRQSSMLSRLWKLAGRPDASAARLVVRLDRQPGRGLPPSRSDGGLQVRGPFTIVHTPPLREIPERIPVLFDRLLVQHSARRLRPTPAVEAPAMDLLRHAPWPGNLRELEALAVRLLAESTAGVLTVAQLRQLHPPAEAEPTDGLPTLFEAEGRLLRRALVETRGNKALAARQLGITRTRLYRKLAEHQLEAWLQTPDPD